MAKKSKGQRNSHGLGMSPKSVRRIKKTQLTGPLTDAWQRCRDVVERHRAALLERPGVIAVEAAPRLAGGKITSDPAIRVHVYRKRARAELSNDELMPERIEGFPVDVVPSSFQASATCRTVAAPLSRAWQRIQGGVTIGTAGQRMIGTLGALFLDEQDPERVLGLTAGHVLPVGETVTQPAAGSASHSIGTVVDSIVSQEMDAGLIEINLSKRGVAAGVAGAGGPERLAALPVDDPEYQPVFMMGGCSGPRVGWARRSSQPIPVDYPAGQIWLDDHIHILAEDRPKPFNVGGDSGALLLSFKGELAIGLVIASGQFEGQWIGLATPIDRVVRHFGVRLAIW